jgi:FKBP-type peptidyl-prolyl cis-trans isomerase FklB
MMKEGARWKLFLPPKLAFGDKGPLEDQTVINDIELISVQPTQ